MTDITGRLPDKVPAVVTELASKVGKSPLAWRIKETAVVIVFEDGPRIVFDRDPKPSLPIELPSKPAPSQKMPPPPDHRRSLKVNGQHKGT